MEQTDRRFRELREDMNKRFEQIDQRFEQIDRGFEETNKRFEDFKQRFDQLMNFLWMPVGIFTALTAAVFGFASWDRRTIIRKVKEETIEAIEREGPLVHSTHALRRLAEENEHLAGIL